GPTRRQYARKRESRKRHTPSAANNPELGSPPGAGLISERLSRLEGVRDALLRFALAAQADERFALKIENVLLGDVLRRGDSAARQNIRQLSRDHAIVFGRVLAADHHVNRQLRRREEILAEHTNFRRSRRMISGANHRQ